MNGKIYLVDTENPGGSLDIASRTADELQTGDAMYLFVTPAVSLKFAVIAAKNKKVQYVECQNGHANALDFQLVSSLGFLFAKHPSARFVVLSDDEGYDPAIAMLKTKGASVCREGKSSKQNLKLVTADKIQPVSVVPSDTDALIAISHEISCKCGIKLKYVLSAFGTPDPKQSLKSTLGNGKKTKKSIAAFDAFSAEKKQRLEMLVKQTKLKNQVSG